jgi:hypothetical protein
MAGFVPPGIAGLLGLFGADQSWKDRLKEAAYTSPGGTRIKFLYEAVSRETTRRTTAFEFPGVNNAYVQDNGNGSRRYPLTCFFSGKDCDMVATAFEAALLERGVGKLEHPLYGTFDVIPFGDITRRDDLKNAANQAVVEVTFWTTTGAVYPSSQTDAASEITAALAGFDVAAAQQFSASTSLGSALSAANAIHTIKSLLRAVSAVLQGISDATASVDRDFRDAQRLVNESMDVLIGQPLQLALQISNLIKAPGRALSGIENRLDGYEALAQRIFGSPAGRPAASFSSGSSIPARVKRISNDFLIADLFATNAVGGSIVSVVNNTFATKTEAVGAADKILSQLDAAVSWRDSGFQAVGQTGGVSTSQVDTGEAYQALQRAASLAAGFLIQLSFSLIPERAIVLDRARTIIDVAAELYGSVDDRLDFLIDTNDLSGNEILELPAGRKIVYYVAAA